MTGRPGGSARSWQDQRKAIARTFLLVQAPTLVLLSVLWFQRTLDLGDLMRDPASTRGGPLHIGLVSNLGVLVWFSAASVCLFTAAVLEARGGRAAAFFFVSGLLTVILTLDDFLMLHEFIGWALSIPETAIVAGYSLLTLAWLTIFWRTIRQTDHLLLVMALGLFALSLLPDVPQVRTLYSSERLMRLLEDGGKLLGIVTWSAYLVQTSARALIDRGHPCKTTTAS